MILALLVILMLIIIQRKILALNSPTRPASGRSLTYIFTCRSPALLLLFLPAPLALTLPILPSVTMLLIRQIDTGVGQEGLKLSQAAFAEQS